MTEVLLLRMILFQIIISFMIIYPLVDTLRAFAIRAYKKQSPFVADRVTYTID